MKKFIILLAIGLFTINVGAQETKPATNETTKKESCCAKKDAAAKTMTAEEIAKCQAHCKAKGKECKVADMAKCKKDAPAKKMTAEEIAKCQEHCKAEGKVCAVNEKPACKKEEKKCCSKKA